eukprot:scaffold2361_cov203-Alexandrium_tamarense.AAC.17
MSLSGRRQHRVRSAASAPSATRSDVSSWTSTRRRRSFSCTEGAYFPSPSLITLMFIVSVYLSIMRIGCSGFQPPTAPLQRSVHPLRHCPPPLQRQQRFNKPNHPISNLSLFGFNPKQHPEDPSYSKKSRTKRQSHHSSQQTDPLFRTAPHSKHTHPRVKVTNANRPPPPSSASSNDRLRVDLMRSKLSVSMAEERANRLEIQLEKMTKNFDDLPPFAAALAANAEREEMERRRKLGLIEESELEEYSTEIDFDGVDLDTAIERASAAAAGLEEELQNFDVEGTLDLSTNQSEILFRSPEEQLSSLNDGKMNASTFSFGNESSSLDSLPDLFHTLNNNTINKINTQYTPKYINDDIQTLRQKCILLTHQHSILQQRLSNSEERRKAQALELKSSMTSERILRGLQADWTRRLSDTRKDIDAQKEEWVKDMTTKTNEWKKEREGLEEQLRIVQEERDNLALSLESQKNITFVMHLFIDLAKERVAASYSNTTATVWRKLRYGNNPAPNRMLTVGGVTGQRQQRGAVQRFVKSVRSVGERVRSGRNANSSLISGTEADSEGKTNEDQSLPLLVRKKRRRSKLYYPEPRIQANDGSAEVPNFLREGSD